MDAKGRPFIEAAVTANVSRKGVLLQHVPAHLAVGDLVGLTYAQRRHKFRVIWTGAAGTVDEGRVGLQALESSDWIWEVKLPADDSDMYMRPPECDHRLTERVKCFLSAEISADKAQRVLVFVRDLSLGGCYLGMTAPLPLQSKLSMALWLDEQTKVCAEGIVVSSHPGEGMGIKFLGLSRANLAALETFMTAVTTISE